MRRSRMSRSASRANFRHGAMRVNRRNLVGGFVMRGGIRL